MQKGRQILSPERFKITLTRLAHELIENYPSEEALYIVGIQEKGVILADRLIEEIKKKKEIVRVKKAGDDEPDWQDVSWKPKA